MYIYFEIIINFLLKYIKIFFCNLNNYIFNSNFKKSNLSLIKSVCKHEELTDVADKLVQMGLIESKSYNIAQYAETVSGTKIQLEQDYLQTQIIDNTCNLLINITPFVSNDFARFKNTNLITLESVKFNYVFTLQFTLEQLLNKNVLNSIILMQDILEYYFNVDITSSNISFKNILDLSYDKKYQKKIYKYTKEYVLAVRSILDQLDLMGIITTFDNVFTQTVIYFEPDISIKSIKKSGVVKLFPFTIQTDSGLEKYVIFYGYGFNICDKQNY